jgi:hypothetical protein
MREARVKSDPADIQAQVSLARALDFSSAWRLRFDDLPGARRDAERAIEIVEPLTAKNNDGGQRRILESARHVRAMALGQVPRGPDYQTWRPAPRDVTRTAPKASATGTTAASPTARP